MFRRICNPLAVNIRIYNPITLSLSDIYIEVCSCADYKSAGSNAVGLQITSELKIHFFGNELMLSKKSFSTWLKVRC